MKISMKAQLMMLAAGLMIVPVAFAADGPSQPRRLADDVALQTGGVLTGRMTDVEGKGKAGVAITLVQQGKTVAQTTSGDDGRFSIPELRAGVYQIRSDYGAGVYRLWAPRTAPPSAQQEVALNATQKADVVRGQQPQGDTVRGGVPTIVEDTYIDDLLIGGTLFGLLGWGIYEIADHNPPGPVGPASKVKN